jgi:hypothetical protein
MRALVCITVALLSSTQARADVSKAWAAAKDNLPADTRAVAAIDIAAIVKAASWPKALAAVLASDRDLEKGYGLVKTSCKIDPAAVVQGIVVAGTPDHERGVVFIQLGVDRVKLLACAASMLKTMGAQEKLDVKTDGNITTLTLGKSDSIHVAWVTGDVLAISTDPVDKDRLAAWIGQKGAYAKTKVAAIAAKADTKAVAWGAFSLDKPLDKEVTAISGTGSANLANGNITVAIRATFVDAAGAARTYADMQKDMAKDLKKDRTPEAMKKVIRAIKLATKGSDVTLDVSVKEADLAAAIEAAATH